GIDRTGFRARTDGSVPPSHRSCRSESDRPVPPIRHANPLSLLLYPLGCSRLDGGEDGLVVGGPHRPESKVPFAERVVPRQQLLPGAADVSTATSRNLECCPIGRRC